MKMLLEKKDNGYVDEEGCFWESPTNWLFVGLLGGCGCGSYEEMENLSWKILEHFATDYRDRKFSVYDKLEYEAMAQWLQSKDLTEHGTAIGASWLSEKGENVYKTILQLKQNS